MRYEIFNFLKRSLFCLEFYHKCAVRFTGEGAADAVQEVRRDGEEDGLDQGPVQGRRHVGREHEPHADAEAQPADGQAHGPAVIFISLNLLNYLIQM